MPKRKLVQSDVQPRKKACTKDALLPSILKKCENPVEKEKVGVLDPSKHLKNFKRMDKVKRDRKPIDLNDKKNLTIVVTNPAGTGFMSKAGMAAIMVKFKSHQHGLNLEAGKLYNISLKEQDGHLIELLYFTKDPNGAQGEIILLKWDAKSKCLKPIKTVAQGANLDDGLYQVQTGMTWMVEGMYEIRAKVPRKNVIETIRKDIRYLENIKRTETNRIIKQMKKEYGKTVPEEVTGKCFAQ